MDYTESQYAVMEQLANRLIWDNLTESKKEIVSFLVEEKIAAPRAYIEDGLFVLTERGKCVLEDHRRKILAASEAELFRLQQTEKEASEKSKQERQQKFENKIAIANLLIPFVTYILGIITEHYTGIIAFLIELFR